MRKWIKWLLVQVCGELSGSVFEILMRNATQFIDWVHSGLLLVLKLNSPDITRTKALRLSALLAFFSLETISFLDMSETKWQISIKPRLLFVCLYFVQPPFHHTDPLSYFCLSVTLISLLLCKSPFPSTFFHHLLWPGRKMPGSSLLKVNQI